jgi:hypothetical protein
LIARVYSDRAMAVEMVWGVMVMSRSNGANTMESSKLNIYSYTVDAWMEACIQSVGED